MILHFILPYSNVSFIQDKYKSKSMKKVMMYWFMVNLLCWAYIIMFWDENLYANISDTYYVIAYPFLGIFFTTISLLLIRIIKYLLKKNSDIK